MRSNKLVIGLVAFILIIFWTPVAVSQTISDSDHVYLLDPTYGHWFAYINPWWDTSFVMAVMLENTTPVAGINIPIAFYDVYSYLHFDTTVVEPATASLAITFGPTGRLSSWIVRSSVLSTHADTLLVVMHSDPPIPPSNDTLLYVHVYYEGGFHSGFDCLDTTFVPPFSRFRIQDSSGTEYIPRWDYGCVTWLWDYVAEGAGATLPSLSTLSAPSPNPFNASTQTTYRLTEPSNVVMSICNIQGRRVATLQEGIKSAGEHTAIWNGTDDRGRPVGSGVYFYRLNVNGESTARKMLLLK